MLRCPGCTGPLQMGAQEAACPACTAFYPIRSGIVDMLGDPPAAVAQELRGLAAENAIDTDSEGLGAVKFMEVASIDSPAAVLDRTRNDRIQYYQLTTSSYLEGLSRCLLDSNLKVLEIGADLTLWNLRVLKDMCAEAVAVNIYFQVVTGAPVPDWPLRVLADMNHLPFEDGYFDLVVCSATLHHSSDIPGALAEIARVLRPGGRALVVNEPVAGFAKGLGGGQGHDRNHLIHEVPVTFAQWLQAIRKSGLQADHFLPAWYTRRLRFGGPLPAGTRFAGLARRLGPVTKHRALAELVSTAGRVPGQTVLGLPLNAVLWKPV